MHGQVFTCLSASPGDWTASNGHKVTFQHNSDPVQIKFTALTNIPNYGFVNGAFRYNFTSNAPSSDLLKFAFENNTDPLNGVNVWDLSLISRHIQSIPAFTNPYQMLAADVNASGTITTFDIVQLRKLILGQFTNFGQISSLVNSWRFVPLNRFFFNRTLI